VTAVVALGGLAAATRWLLGGAWLYLFAAGAAGVAATAAAIHVGRFRQARSSAVRELLDAMRAGEAVVVARGLAHGLSGAWPPVLAMGVGLAAAWKLGALSQLAGGELLALSTTLSTILASAAYMLALGMVGSVASAAVGVLEVDEGALTAEARKQAGHLEQAGLDATSVSQAYFILVGCAGALLTATLLPLLLTSPRPTTTVLSVSDPAVLYCGLLGAPVILAFVGSALAQAARAARVAVLEVERQLRAFPKEAGVAVIPADFAPSYRTVVEQTTRQASSRVVAPVALALVAPAVLGFALRVLYSSGALAIEGLVAFVVIASATGLALALAADGARAVLSAAYRASRPRGGPPGFEVSLTGNAVADLLGCSAAPAAHLLVKAVALTALVIAPLLSN
jgi:Na+/H+-translocating membrane pyrophosphatase